MADIYKEVYAQTGDPLLSKHYTKNIYRDASTYDITYNRKENKRVAQIIVLVGNIGSGKSSLAQKYFENGYLIIDKDLIRTMLGGGKYVYDENIEPLLEHVEGALIGVLATNGYNIVIDSCNVSLLRRLEYIQVANMLNAEVLAHILPVVDKEVAIQRRMSDARGISREQWEKVYDKFAEQYVEPSIKEGFSEIRSGNEI